MRSGSEPPSLAGEVAEHLSRLEAATEKRFGDPRNPLLLSVRSGGPISMPGMMETRPQPRADAQRRRRAWPPLRRPQFAYDAYRRLIQMYGNVVEGIDGAAFESAIEALKVERGVELDSQLTATDFELLADAVRGDLPRAHRQ